MVFPEGKASTLREGDEATCGLELRRQCRGVFHREGFCAVLGIRGRGGPLEVWWCTREVSSGFSCGTEAFAKPWGKGVQVLRRCGSSSAPDPVRCLVSGTGEPPTGEACTWRVAARARFTWILAPGGVLPSCRANPTPAPLPPEATFPLSYVFHRSTPPRRPRARMYCKPMKLPFLLATRAPLLAGRDQSDQGARSLADAVLLMPPCSSMAGGVQAGERGTEAFLRRALEACELPVFLYSAPGEAGGGRISLAPRLAREGIAGHPRGRGGGGVPSGSPGFSLAYLWRMTGECVGRISVGARCRWRDVWG